MIVRSAFLLFLILSVPLWAVPACPQEFTAQQPNGYQFSAQQHGDEWNNWIETRDGSMKQYKKMIGVKK